MHVIERYFFLYEFPLFTHMYKCNLLKMEYSYVQVLSALDRILLFDIKKHINWVDFSWFCMCEYCYFLFVCFIGEKDDHFDQNCYFLFWWDSGGENVFSTCVLYQEPSEWENIGEGGCNWKINGNEDRHPGRKLRNSWKDMKKKVRHEEKYSVCEGKHIKP